MTTKAEIFSAGVERSIFHIQLYILILSKSMTVSLNQVPPQVSICLVEVVEDREKPQEMLGKIMCKWRLEINTMMSMIIQMLTI